MAKHEFNRDLDDYIHSKKNAGKKPLFGIKFSSGSSSSSNSPQKNTSAANPAPKAKPAGPRDFTEDEVKMAMKNQMPELEEEEAAPKQGGFSSFIAWFKGSPSSSEEDVDMPVEQQQQTIPASLAPQPVSAEVGEVLKIAGKWLNRLDDSAKAEFKASTDYAKYKYLLEKLRKQ